MTMNKNLLRRPHPGSKPGWWHHHPRRPSRRVALRLRRIAVASRGVFTAVAVAVAIAVAVARQAQAEGVALKSSDDAIRESVARHFWYPRYRRYRRAAF